MSSNIISIGLANPKHCIEQHNVFEFMGQAHGLEGSALTRLKALYRASGIKKRYSVINDYQSADQSQWTFYPTNKALEPFPTTDDRAKLYRKEAQSLSAQAAKNAFNHANLSFQDITHLITISCTGMYAPGLDIDLIHQLGLKTSVERTCVNFMGCYAAFTGIKLGDQICRANPKAKVLIVATELCTIHFQKGADDDNLLANAIFGDGSAAVIMSAEKTDSKNNLVLSPTGFLNEIYPEGSSEMAWNIGNFGFEMKLSAYVPSLIEKGIGELVNRLKSQSATETINHFAFHPGGKRILEVIESELELSKEADWAGRTVLENYGNMSSPTILFVIKQLWDSLTTENRNESILSLAFGPGLTMESMLLRVC
ncbi:type III polyketide synthase [Roseivirga spongicola]|uniref:Naringenin-chalcone synthase n=1 Tax=Roseivirga spongicola TaxID=333140 RepID=A0A150XH43_9BACT|nr:type III polyketide synthase [Roseivirga spongicola]KYG78021.1 naringenin-chalcone synthase [Roseivirga spongicola]WPZ11757.1 type III polyketide synthase [Roseivirga spongicola]